MNQILSTENDKNIFLIEKNFYKKNKLKPIFFKIQFILCVTVATSISIYYSYSLYINSKKENLSRKLLNNYNITTLYNNYTPIRTNLENTYETEGNNFFVIGLIDIKKIQLNYPIISNYNDELLKIAPCRFSGPMPNEVGNLCIAGHNYNSYKFFSRLKELSIDDIISIYDLSRTKKRLYCI